MLVKIAKRLLVLGLVLIGLAFVPQSRIRETGLDFWELPRLKADLAESEARQRVLEDEAEAVTKRIAVKDQLVKELITGKTTLAAVTDKFTALNGDDPEILGHLRESYRVQDERELSALNALAFAESLLTADDARTDASKVLQRLDREFDAMFPEKKADWPRK